MNERIRELWTSVCQNEMPELDETCMTLSRQRKFAELIFQECIRCCEGNSEYKNHTDTEWGKGLASGIGLCKEAMKTHFGVK
jgi:hypothetical protein